MPKSPLIFLSAGEASGDHYGAELIASVRAVMPNTRFTGLGGTALEAAGQHRVIRAEDVAVMGITEILRHVPRIVRSYRTLVRSIVADPPDIAVLIDFPDVNFRLAKHLKRLKIPVLWFVSPQLWAWKRRRLRWVRSRVSRMLTIFPFEEPFYRHRGVKAEFVGHPLAEAALPLVSREDFAAEVCKVSQAGRSIGCVPDPALDGIACALDEAKPWIALLPGSRRGEIERHFRHLVETAKLLGHDYEYLVPLAPGTLEAQLRWMQSVAGDDQLTGFNAPRIVFVQDARAALLHSRAAVIASGTATVQAAVLGTPFVAVYRVSRTTFALAKRLVRYPDEISAQVDEHGNLPIAMPNLVAGRRVVPELLQEQFTADAVTAALRPLLQDGPERKAQIEGLAEVRRRLLHPAGARSIDRLRDAVLDALQVPNATTSSPRPNSASNE